MQKKKNYEKRKALRVNTSHVSVNISSKSLNTLMIVNHGDSCDMITCNHIP